MSERVAEGVINGIESLRSRKRKLDEREKELNLKEENFKKNVDMSIAFGTKEEELNNLQQNLKKLKKELSKKSKEIEKKEREIQRREIDLRNREELLAAHSHIDNPAIDEPLLTLGLDDDEDEDTLLAPDSDSEEPKNTKTARKEVVVSDYEEDLVFEGFE